ncbi:MAG: hypothetical protein F7B59_01455 [Desulfurococcales archaeon]|nr:hypothetical protein [Desulfurococcales archaeon]
MDAKEKHRLHVKRYAYDLLDKLLSNREQYFDRFNRLNSDGMRVLRRLNRALMASSLVSPRIVKRIWKNPTYEYLNRIRDCLENKR